MTVGALRFPKVLASEPSDTGAGLVTLGSEKKHYFQHGKKRRTGLHF